MQDLDNSAIDEHVNVTIKVINVHPIETLVSKSGKHLAKQECIVADSTATARMVLWENNIGRLSLNCSYKLEDVLIRAFQNIKYLSISENTMLVEVEDIETVDNQLNDTLKGVIVGVMSTEEYVSCFQCNAKVQQITSVLGTCTKCNMEVKLDACDLYTTATVYLRCQGEKQKHRVTLFQREINIITAGVAGVSLSQKLWNVPKIKVCINARNIAISASVVVPDTLNT